MDKHLNLSKHAASTDKKVFQFIHTFPCVEILLATSLRIMKDARADACYALFRLWGCTTDSPNQ